MPKYEVELNGNKFEIEAPDDQALSAAVAQLQQSQESGQHLSFEEGAALLDRERMQGASGTVGAALTGVLDGVPIAGPAMLGGTQRAAAGLSSLINGGSYDENLNRAREITATAQEEHPYVTTGANIVGGVAGTIPMVAAAPGAFGVGTGGLLARTAASGLSGSVIGGADSAVRSGGDPLESLKGGVIGLGAGLAGPAIGKGIGAGIRYARGATSDALSGISKPAQRFLEGQFSDPARVASQQQALSRLGPNAVLADVSPEWLGVARGAASRPGTRDAIVEALDARSSAANARLRMDMNANLGQPIIPSQVERAIGASQDAVAEGYGPVMANARAVNTQPIADRLDAITTNLRGPAQRAVREIRGYLDIPGTNVLDPNPQALMASRQAIDGLMGTETNDQVVRQLTIARQEIDGLLAQAAPGVKEVDAQFAELARQRTALQQGRPILSNEASAIRPEELNEILAEGVQPQGLQVGPSAVPTRMRQAVRAEIDRAVGTKANDTTALRQIVRGEGDWNREKLGTLFGQENADRALAAIDRETVFGDTANRVTRGSDTAMGSGFGKFLDETSKAADIPSDSTLIGLGIKGGKRVLEAVLKANAESNAGRYANEIGQLSVADGAIRDQIVDSLLRRAQGLQASSNPKIQAVINALMLSSGQQLSR
jgi:hypothetical protein